MKLDKIVTYPRSGANYLHNLIFNYSSISIGYVHKTDNINGTIITIARDPFESIHSDVAMRKHYHPEEGYNKTYNTRYIDMYNFLYNNADIVIDYKDLIESPNQVVEKTCNILGLEKLLNDRPQRGDDEDQSYLVSSKTSPQYKEKHFNIEYINDCYEPYTRLLSRSIDLT
jgi:hypothetical protein